MVKNLPMALGVQPLPSCWRNERDALPPLCWPGGGLGDPSRGPHLPVGDLGDGGEPGAL